MAEDKKIGLTPDTFMASLIQFFPAETRPAGKKNSKSAQIARFTALEERLKKNAKSK